MRTPGPGAPLAKTSRRGGGPFLRVCVSRAGRRAALGLLLPVAGLACSAPGAGPRVEFSVVHSDEVREIGRADQVASELASPQPQSDGVSVRGIILVPDPCDDVRARIDPDTMAVVLRVTARLSRAHAGRCDREGQTTILHYHAILRDLPPGTGRLRVVHDYQGLPASDPSAARWAEHVAYDGPVGGAGSAP
jgi:hypothetical protein